jgi:hypothetical protein
MRPVCWFEYLGNCDGRLVKAHLIPKQRIKREYPSGAYIEIVPPNAVIVGDARYVPLGDILWNERCWTWMCGGPTGIGGHHGAFDAKQIRITPWDLPPSLLEYAQEYGLEWCLERDYGLKV